MADNQPQTKAVPPSDGNWIVVDMPAHRITTFEEGKALPNPIEHFSVGRKSKAGHDWLTHTEDQEILSDRRYKVGYRSHSFPDPKHPKLGAPMNYALFFNQHGQAFHEGDVNTESHGCIHLKRTDAARLFEWVGEKKYGSGL